jgi:hypothetical protein
MDDAMVRAKLERHWEFGGSDQDIAHEIYHDDAVLEFPQSGERFVGVENFREWRRIYPASLAFEIRNIRGRDDLWIAENSISYDGGAWNLTVSILEFQGDKVARETIYITQPWEPRVARPVESCAITADRRAASAVLEQALRHLGASTTVPDL